MEIEAICDLVLPCHDEAAALPGLLARGTAGLLGDRGRQRLARRDRRRRPGATGPASSASRGSGTAPRCTPGVEAATAEYVAVMDGDGSFDPAELPALLAAVAAGGATWRSAAVAPCRPGSGRGTRGLGNALVVWWLRRSVGFPVHDLAPMRVCRREDLLDLDVRDRRFGYPARAAAEGHARRLAARGARRHLPPARRRHDVEGQRQPARHDAHGPRLLEGAVLGGGRA